MGINRIGAGLGRAGDRPYSEGEQAARVIQQEIKGLEALAAALDPEVLRLAVEALKVEGKVIVSGVGKSGHIARKVASSMTSMGTPAIFLHPTEAAHGDLGILGPSDAVLVFSRSGKAMELYPLMEAANNLPVVLVSEEPTLNLALWANIIIGLPPVAEAWGHAPTTSTIMQMAIGDALAVILADLKGVTQEAFQKSHPGGVLGGRK
jgi:arabinose-5-phosphate isomerase